MPIIKKPKHLTKMLNIPKSQCKHSHISSLCCPKWSWNHRDSFRLEKTSKTIESSHFPSIAKSFLPLPTILLQYFLGILFWAQHFSLWPINTQFVSPCLLFQGESFRTETIFSWACPGQGGPGLQIGFWQLVHIKNNCNHNNISHNCSDMDFCHISAKYFLEIWSSIGELKCWKAKNLVLVTPPSTRTTFEWVSCDIKKDLSFFFSRWSRPWVQQINKNSSCYLQWKLLICLLLCLSIHWDNYLTPANSRLFWQIFIGWDQFVTYHLSS